MRAFHQKRFISALILLLSSVLTSAYLYYYDKQLENELINIENNRYQSYLLITQLRRSSDELTRLARTYVATGNTMFEKQYREVLAIRNGLSSRPVNYDRVYWDLLSTDKGKPPYVPGAPIALKQLMINADFTESELALLTVSQENSDALVKLEQSAFNAMKGKHQNAQGEFVLSPKANQQFAIELLHSNEYHRAKAAIMFPINNIYAALDERSKQQISHAVNSLDTNHIFSFSIFLIMAILLIALIAFTIKEHNNIVSNLKQNVSKKSADLEVALKEIKTLKGILSICSTCHSIKNEAGEWVQMESYISDHSDAKFSHGYCPDCITKVRDDYGLDD